MPEMTKQALRDRDALETVEWGQQHFGSLTTNHQFPRRKMARLERLGLVECIGFVEPCDGDGSLIAGRERPGYVLTAAGRAAIAPARPHWRDDMSTTNPGVPRPEEARAAAPTPQKPKSIFTVLRETQDALREAQATIARAASPPSPAPTPPIKESVTTPMPDRTCPCGNPLIRDGVVVKAHWTGAVCDATLPDVYAIADATHSLRAENTRLEAIVAALETAHAECEGIKVDGVSTFIPLIPVRATLEARLRDAERREAALVFQAQRVCDHFAGQAGQPAEVMSLRLAIHDRVRAARGAPGQEPGP